MSRAVRQVVPNMSSDVEKVAGHIMGGATNVRELTDILADCLDVISGIDSRAERRC